jgi:hypothetical protein
MKTSKILKRAKKHLATDYKMGICRAVSGSYWYVDRVQAMISRRLDGWAYANDWLGHQVLFPEVDFDNLTSAQFHSIYNWSKMASAKDIQAWRHAWLDRMIAEFEAKGD